MSYGSSSCNLSFLRTRNATSIMSHLLSASSHFHASTKMALEVHSPLTQAFKGPLLYFKAPNGNWGVKPNQVLQNTRLNINCAMDMAAGQWGDPGKMRLDNLMGKARELWDSSPQPVKSFPWNRVLDNFIQLILDLIIAVVKYLSVPLLAVSSLSEMSYCAHQKKLLLIPFPLIIGIAVAGILNRTALELSPLIKGAEVPWHLVASAIFFTLLKLPGPYYPYWGRIFIPHLANGALWRTLWLAVQWFRRPKRVHGEIL